jgi:hypothetical protein
VELERVLAEFDEHGASADPVYRLRADRAFDVIDGESNRRVVAAVKALESSETR